MDDFDIIAAFEQDFDTQIPERPVQRDTFKYSYFDMCNNQGSVIGRLLVDGNGKVFRRIDGLVTGYLPCVGKSEDEKLFMRIVPASNFEGHYELTESQKELLKNIMDLLDKHWEHFETLKFKESYQVYIFYMMIQNYNRTWDDKEETFGSPKPTVMVHRSARFLESFKKAVNDNHKARAEKEWLKAYAERKVGPTFHMTQISTTRTTGYETQVTFNELPGRKIEIFEDDLEHTKDLYNEYVSVTSFNDEYYTNIYEELKKYCDELEKSAGIEDYQKPSINN